MPTDGRRGRIAMRLVRVMLFLLTLMVAAGSGYYAK